MRCLDCKNCDLRSRPEMARRGFARCKFVESWCYPSVSASRECANFVAATPKAVEERTTWLQNQYEFMRRQLA